MDYEQRSGSSYYTILGVDRDSSVSEIRRAYRKLAMRWHPDRWTRTPSLLGEAKRKFQQIQEAYAVLSDQRKRSMYDAGLYNPNDDDEDENNGSSDFVQEMLSLMASVKRERKAYSLEELQQMLTEMAQGFDESREDSRDSKKARWSSSSSSSQQTLRSSHVHVSGLGLCR